MTLKEKKVPIKESNTVRDIRTLFWILHCENIYYPMEVDPYDLKSS